MFTNLVVIWTAHVIFKKLLQSSNGSSSVLQMILSNDANCEQQIEGKTLYLTALAKECKKQTPRDGTEHLCSL